MNLPRTALTLSILMFLLGFMLLCNCPGWYVTSALFAALAAWKGRGKFRVYSLMLAGAALLIALAHAVAEYK